MGRLLLLLSLGLVVGAPAHPAVRAESPLAWSPDGHWLAFTTHERPDLSLPPLGWSLDLKTPLELSATAPLSAKPSAVANRWQIWTARADVGRYVKLEESSSPLTAPAWRPDGRSLAFGRLIPEENGRARFEVVVQEAPSEKRVILKESIDESAIKNLELSSLHLAWSPEGRYLVVPVLQNTRGLAIIRADNGRVLKTLEDAHHPSWSADGTKLAFARGLEGESLLYLDNNFGAPRHLADIGKALQAPIWYKQSILVLARPGGLAAEGNAELLRVPVDGGKPEPLFLGNDANARERGSAITSVTFDKESENLFFTTDVPEQQTSEIVWYRLRTREITKRYNPVEHPLWVGALAMSPNGKSLGFRAGDRGASQPIGLCDITERGFSPLVPNDSERVAWLKTLIAGCRRLLGTSLPPAVSPAGQLVERLSPLPVPGELPANHGSLPQLRRFGRYGRSLCQRPKDAPVANLELQRFLTEARLFFAYLSDDYVAALTSLESLETDATQPDARLKLLSVRAQIFLGQGDAERAQETIAYLLSSDRSKSRRVEETPLGTVLVDETSAAHGWPSFLAMRAKKLGESKEGNQGDPLNGADGEVFDPQRPMAPFGPQNLGQFQVDVAPAMLGDLDRPAFLEPRRPQRLIPTPPGLRRVPPPPRPLPRPRRFFPGEFGR